MARRSTQPTLLYYFPPDNGREDAERDMERAFDVLFEEVLRVRKLTSLNPTVQYEPTDDRKHTDNA